MVQRRKAGNRPFGRDQMIVGLFVVVAALLGLRLFTLQVLQHGFYVALAADTHQLSQQLLPTRGQILVKDPQSTTGVYPLAANKTLHLLYAIPKQVSDPIATADALVPLTTLTKDELLARLDKPNDLYEPIQHSLTDEQRDAITALNIDGLAFSDEQTRYYPEKNLGSHLLGFLGYDNDIKVGRYGLEGHYQDALAGQRGFIEARKRCLRSADRYGGTNLAASGERIRPVVDH